MPISAPPTIPQITDPSTFATRAQDWVVWQADELYPALVEESLTLGLSLSGSSVTSNTVGTGSKSFTVETGKGFAAGQSIVIADSATPTNRMFGVVDTYDSGTGALVFISQAFEGSGTLTAWTISPTLNAVITAAQVPDGLITNAKLDNGYIDDLTIVTLDPTVDYVAIADGSDTGNKKKALIPEASESALGLVELATDVEYVTGTDATRVLTPSVARSNNIVSGVTVTASGTSVDFTGIPSWVKRLTIMLSGMSTNGTSPVIIRIGDSGGVENTGYNGVTLNSMGAAVNTANHSSGILQDNAGASTYIRNGCIQFTKIAGNTWIYVGLIGNSEAARSNQYSGSKSLSDVLTQIRVTTVGGTDDFDAGSINILYE